MKKKVFSIIKKIFRFFNIEIKFIKKAPNIDAVEYNSVEKTDEFYRNPKKLKNYLEKSRLEFYENIFTELEKNNKSLNNLSVSDVGCGMGKLFYYIEKKYKVKNFVGFDFSPEAINYTKSQYPNAKFFVHDIYKPYNQRFDFVFCTEVLEHLLYPEKALENLLDMLTDQKSTLLLTVPNGRTDNFAGHINFWSPESWEVFIKKYTQNYQTKFGFIGDKLFAIIGKS